jgi:hypothetical protein
MERTMSMMPCSTLVGECGGSRARGTEAVGGTANIEGQWASEKYNAFLK